MTTSTAAITAAQLDSPILTIQFENGLRLSQA